MLRMVEVKVFKVSVIAKRCSGIMMKSMEVEVWCALFLKFFVSIDTISQA